MRRELPVWLTVGLLLISVATAGAQSVSFHTIAAVGQAAPGGGTFATIDKWDYSANSHGVVAFIGSTDSGAGIWKWSSGTFELIAKEGDPATELGAGFSFGGLLSPSVNGNGAVGFISGVGGASVDLHNIMAAWVAGSLGLHAVAHGGSSVPGITSIEPFLAKTRLNSNGQMAIHRLVGAIPTAIWFRSDGEFEQIAAVGQPQPGRPGNFVYVGEPQLSETGVLAFGSSEALGKSVLWTYSAGSLQMLAGEGVPMPGISGELFDGGSFQGPLLAPNGYLVFKGGNQAGDIRGIWTSAPGQSPQLLVRTGIAAPGTSSTFLDFTNIGVNSSGTIALTGLVEDVGGVVYLGKVGSSLQPVLTAGQAAVGMPAGYVFQGNQVRFMLDDVGNLAMVGLAMLPGDFKSQTQGLWLRSTDGDLLNLLVVGQPINVDGTPHTVEEFTFVSDNAPGNFLTDGLPPVWAKFTDGSSGLFTISVPEPGIAVSALLIGCAMLTRKKKTVAS